MRRLFLVVLAGLAATARAGEEMDLAELMKGNVPAWTIRKGHPRIFITPDNKAEIIRRITTTPVGRSSFQAVINAADAGMKTDFAAIADGNPRNVYPKFLTQIESCGAIHQLGQVPGFRYGHDLAAYGPKGVEALTALAALKQAAHGSGYDRMTALAAGYDWLHDLMSDQQRRAVVKRLIDTVKVYPVGTDDQREGGWAFNSPRGAELINPLAFHGDGIADDVAVGMIDRLVRRTLWGPTGSLTRLERLQGGGVGDEELIYSNRYDRFMPALAAWHAATGQDFFNVGTFWTGWMKWRIYNLFPHADAGKGGWFIVKMHQGHMSPTLFTRGSCTVHAMATGYMARAGDPAWAAVTAWAAYGVDTGFWGPTRPDPFFYGVLMGDPTLKPATPFQARLPTYHNIPGPLARLYMHSGWNDPDACYAMHSVSEWACLRCTDEAMNAVVIWKNGGPLLHHQFGYGHDYGPPYRYNLIHLYAPGDAPRRVVPTHSLGLGDNRWIDTTQFTDRLKAGFQRAAKVEPGKYGYAAGDASRYYQAYSDKRVRTSDRQFLWFQAPERGKPDYFLLFDRVLTTGKGLQPHVVLNVVNEPEMSADFAAPEPGRKIVDGHWVNTDTPCVKITFTHQFAGHPKAHARLFVRALLPKRVRTHRVGGEGLRYAMDLDGTVFNQDRARRTEGDWGHLTGWWRFHVVDQEVKAENLFLHAMEATDSSQAAPTGPMTLVEGEGLVGGRVGDVIGLFSREYKPLTAGSAEAPAGAEGKFRVLIADLQPKQPYRLTLGETARSEPASEAGTIYLENIQLKPGARLAVEAEK